MSEYTWSERSLLDYPTMQASKCYYYSNITQDNKPHHVYDIWDRTVPLYWMGITGSLTLFCVQRNYLDERRTRNQDQFIY